MVKKCVAVALSMVMVMGLAGCGSGGNDVKLGDYKGLVVYHDDIEVTDEDYQETADYLLSQDETTETVTKGKVKSDSVVVVDYVGEIKVNGEKVAFDGGTASDQSIDMSADSESYIDGFVSALKGHKVGDEFTEKLKFPDDYGQTTTIDDEEIDLSGQPVWFTYTITGLSKTVTPELTDEWAVENYGACGVTDLDSFEDYIKDQLRISNIMSKVWDDFVDTCTVNSYDSEEKESLLTYYNEYYESQVSSYYGMDMTAYLEACSMTEDEWESQMTDEAESSMKTEMIVEAIAKKEGLNLADDEYDSEAAALSAQYSATVEEMESYYGKDQVEYAIVYQRVQKFIADNVEEKEGSEPTTEETTQEETTAEDSSDDAE